MTRAEAIIILKNEQPHCGKRALFPEEKKYEAYDVAIKALEQQTCEDAVSREAAINAVNDVIADYVPNLFGRYEALPLEMASAINRLPSVNPQHTDEEIQKMQELEQAEIQKAYELGKAEKPKMGHWIFDEILDKHYYCSECKSMGVDYWDFCPYCGAKMVEPQESEE